MSGIDEPTQVAPPAPVRSRTQAVVALLLLAVIVALIAVLLQIRARGGELQTLAAAACRRDPHAVLTLRRYVYAVLAVVPPSTFAFAGYIGVQSRRVRREGVFPPAGMWMIRRPARTFSGAAAQRCATVMFAFAAALSGLAVLLTVVSIRMLALLAR